MLPNQNTRLQCGGGGRRRGYTFKCYLLTNKTVKCRGGGGGGGGAYIKALHDNKQNSLVQGKGGHTFKCSMLTNRTLQGRGSERKGGGGLH